EISSQLSDKLESYKCSGSEKNAVFLSMIRQLHYSIYEEPQHDWNSGDEAEKIGISQSYFQHLYRQYLNVSFNADVIGARMTLAERLLLNTSLNVSEIAERCGYPDASHFMKLFRRKNGQTALSYRKNNRK
ncbi:MAG: helix-turn-helix transcriptional regulator, partial [Ruminococcus sp.]|nr:helix-turn-helix transcriptional regulator [Ruminococcus sp.]